MQSLREQLGWRRDEDRHEGRPRVDFGRAKVMTEIAVSPTSVEPDTKPRDLSLGPDPAQADDSHYPTFPRCSG